MKQKQFNAIFIARTNRVIEDSLTVGVFKLKQILKQCLLFEKLWRVQLKTKGKNQSYFFEKVARTKSENELNYIDDI